MKLGLAIEIAGTGTGMPERIVTNEDFASRLNTTDEWITKRTGIRERRIADSGQSTLTFAATASRAALAQAGVSPKQIDLIICATFTPDHPLPSTACELQAELGCDWVPAFDLAAACSGFVYGLITAAQYVCNGLARCALVVGAERMSSITDMDDRGTCILFGDGAGAAVIRPSSDPQRGILATRLGADGGRGKLIWVPAGGSREPATARTVNEKLHYLRMHGREVYKFAVTQMQVVIRGTLEDTGHTIDDLALVIPHQSNLRIIESACRKLSIPDSRVFINIEKYGNTSAASIPIAFHEAQAQGRIKPGDLVLIVAFGAGLTWGSALVRV